MVKLVTEVNALSAKAGRLSQQAEEQAGKLAAFGNLHYDIGRLDSKFWPMTDHIRRVHWERERQREIARELARQEEERRRAEEARLRALREAAEAEERAREAEERAQAAHDSYDYGGGSTTYDAPSYDSFSDMPYEAASWSDFESADGGAGM